MRAVERRRWMKSRGGLPYDAEVEYLRSSGTQYFDLGVKLTNNSKVEIEYSSTDVSTNIFGSRVSVSSKNIMGSIGGTANNVTIDFNNSDYSTYRILVSSFSSNRVRITAGKDVRSVYDVQNKTMKDQNTNACTDVFTCDTNAYLLAASGNPYYTTKLKCDLYYCKVWEDGELILDLIPVRVGQTGCLYDRVTKRLFGNAGSGDFVLGQDIVEVDYLESTGTQYIDTGIVPNSYTRLAYHIEVMWTSALSHRQLMGAQNINFFGVNTSLQYESYNTMTQTGSTSSFDVVEFVMAKSGSKTYRRFTYINGTLSTTAWESTNMFSTNNICLFGMLTSDGQAFETNWPCSCRIKNFKIYNDLTSEVYADFVPVRVGTTGYMLDKVEHKLYGNAGSGDFIIGATRAKHYIHNGLIAMWDGIENAGYDKHTSDETKMVELISGNPATIEQDVVWSSGQSAFDTGRTITEKGIATSANNKYIDITFPFNFSGNEWTIEMVQVITTRRTTNVCDALNKAKPWGNVFEIHHYSNTFRIKTSNVSEWNSSQSIVTGVNCWTIRKSTDNIVNLFKNGAWVASANSKNYNLGLITDYISFTNSGHHGVLYAFRIYNRILTGTEVIYNYNVDKLRFGL